MTSIAFTYPGAHAEKKGAVHRLCRPLIGDWMDVRDRRSGEKMDLHVAMKAHGRGLVGSIHVKGSNKWLRMEVSPAWFCAKAFVFERRGNGYSHVATVRLCHQNKKHSVLWQVVGRDQTGCLPQEAVLWPYG
jgi:hypothetical protein